MSNNNPVVLVHGLMGWGPDELMGINYFSTAIQINSPLAVLQSNVAPLSSNHDRACQLAAQIKGCQVDYGQAHAAEFEHEQFGHDYTHDALHPEWSESNPIHLVGHSMGGSTSRMLQHLLAIDHFGWGSNEKWVKSITGIAAVHNGTTLVHKFGVDQESGLVNDNIATNFLISFFELYALAGRFLFDRFYDFDLDYWGLGPQSHESFKDYMERVAHSSFLLGQDNAIYDCTVQRMYDMNMRVKSYPSTYYFSYVTEQTFTTLFSRRHYPELSMNPGLISSAAWMGQKVFSNPLCPGFKDEDWWQNDGIVPSFSQFYPRISGNHQHKSIGRRTTFEPGIWYSKALNSWDHLDIVFIPALWQIGHQSKFYTEVFERLAAL